MSMEVQGNEMMGSWFEAVEREQLQGASLSRTGCASLLHCHTTYFEDSGTLEFN